MGLMNLFSPIMKVIGGTSDEVFGRWVSDKIFGRESRPTPPASQEDKVESAEAMLPVWGLLEEGSRRNFIRLWSDPAFARFRQKAEKGLDQLLAAAKNGIFKEKISKITEEYPSPDGKKVLKKITERMAAPTGWAPEELFLNALNTAGNNTDDLKVFLEMITRETIFERIEGGALGNITKETVREAGKAAYTALKVYGVLLGLTLLLSIVFGVWFATRPGPVVLVLMIASFGAFGGLVSIPFIVGPKLVPGGK